MIVQSSDIFKNKVYYTDGKTITSDVPWLLKHTSLAELIYYSPSASTMLSNLNTDTGSAFSGFTAISPSWMINLTDNSVTLEEPALSLDLYIDALYQIELKTYESLVGQKLLLLYSGGIDSIVAASFITKLGLWANTTVLSYCNRTTSDPTCLHMDPDLFANVSEFHKWAESRGAKSVIVDFALGELVQTINQYEFPAATSFTTNFIANRYPGLTVISGLAGNVTYLHRQEFAKLAAGDQSKTTCSQFYMRPFEPPAVFALEKCFFYKKHRNWAKNKVVTPGYTDQVMQMVRRLDFSEIPVEYVLDACVARMLICRNVPQLEEFVVRENPADADSVAGQILTFSDLQQDIFKIPVNINHNRNGLAWLRHSLALATETNKIELNTVMSFKNLQHLASLLQ